MNHAHEKAAALKTLQASLRMVAKLHKGIAAPPSVGEYDSETKEAVRAFQQLVSLPATGEADEPTWTALMAEARRIRHAFSPPEKIAAFKLPFYTVKPGESSPLVRILQVLLGSLADAYENFPRPSASGELDAETQSAVRFLQAASGLPQTGSVDRDTWDFLAKAFNTL